MRVHRLIPSQREKQSYLPHLLNRVSGNISSTCKTLKNRKLLRFWYWSTNIRREVRGGEKVVTNTQSWLGGDTLAYRSMYSVNRASDFLPLFHSETIGGKTKAYNWSERKISGADTIPGNAAKGFNLDFKALNYNWNLDMETFEQLPLAAGTIFAINFYDAGLDPPEYLLYKVSGSEILKYYDKKEIDCWILSTESSMPNGDKYSQRFWISKDGHEFIKEEDTYPADIATNSKCLEQCLTFSKLLAVRSAGFLKLVSQIEYMKKIIICKRVLSLVLMLASFGLQCYCQVVALSVKPRTGNDSGADTTAKQVRIALFLPELFAGSNPRNAAPAFAPSGKTFFVGEVPDNVNTIMVSNKQGRKWSPLTPAPFSGKYRDLEPAYATNGDYLIFASNRPQS